MRHFQKFVIGLFAMALAACEAGAPPTPPPAPPVREAPKEPEPSLEARRQAQTYLDRGLVALRSDRLLYPESDNAVAWFNKALEAVPGYERAQDGIERVVERYLQLATQAAEGDALKRATLFVQRAKLVRPDYPQIEVVERQVERIREAERRELKLDGDRLENRSHVLAGDLAAFGRHARMAGRLVRIFVPSDTLGRWVYEQLSRSEGEERIRADIVTSSPYRVQLLIFEQ